MMIPTYFSLLILQQNFKKLFWIYIYIKSDQWAMCNSMMMLCVSWCLSKEFSMAASLSLIYKLEGPVQLSEWRDRFCDWVWIATASVFRSINSFQVDSLSSILSKIHFLALGIFLIIYILEGAMKHFGSLTIYIGVTVVNRGEFSSLCTFTN